MPNGIPRYIRIFDFGEEHLERYTVIFTKKPIHLKGSSRSGIFIFVGMSNNPFHPQGFGQHGETKDPRGGKHLGKRITFAELPPDCKKLVISDYKDIWEI